MFHQRVPRGRQGFTLIELLIVITVIGMLMSMLSWAIWAAVRKAKEAAVTFEINTITAAMQTYKEKFGEYPPNMGATTTSTAPSFKDRNTRFANHMRVAFPRCALAWTTLTSSTASGIPAYIYSGSSRLTYASLDPAEALVFWLGGFPMSNTTLSTNVAFASKRLQGFHLDVTSPFSVDSSTAAGSPYATGNYLKFRTQPFYDFVENRLTDVDGDGWPEYAPKGMPTTPNGIVPPYVYFDATQYTMMDSRHWTGVFMGYPCLALTTTASQNLQNLPNGFGQAVPYAKVDTAPNLITWQTIEGISKAAAQTGTRLQWANNASFQIVSAGLDAMYGDPPAAATTISTAGPFRIPIFPSGFCLKSTPGFATTFTAGSPPPPYDKGDFDNLTNFTDNAVGDAGR